MRKLENPKKKKTTESEDLAVKPAAVQKVDTAEEIAAKAVDKAEKAARKEALKKQKELAKQLAKEEDEEEAKTKVVTTTVTKATVTVKADGTKKVAKKTRVKAADLI